MDSLFKRYGNPTFLIDGLISSHQFSAWIDAQTENVEEETMWEYYIHKLGVFDTRSFNEFRDSVCLGTGKKNPVPTEEQASATIKQSYNLINNFRIMEEGVSD